MESKWENIMGEIIELDEDVVVVIGTADIITHHCATPFSMFEEITPNSFYRIIGRGDDEAIINALTNYTCNLDDKLQPEGEYEFKAIFTWATEDEDYRNHYLEVQHINFNFIQTFAQRKREYIINDLLTLNTKDDDFPF